MAKEIIRPNIKFENQNIETQYTLDFNKFNVYEILFDDGYYVMISDKTTHIKNDDDVEAVLYSPENVIKLYNWVNSKIDEAQFLSYNWFMNLASTENNVYTLIFKRGRPVGGGFL